MQHGTHNRTAIGIVRDHVDDWRRENRWSRETVADMIVQAHERMGGHYRTGIEFDPPTRDIHERLRVNADRIFRWLDDATKDTNLLTVNFLWPILLAMPDERRLQLVDELLSPIGMGAHAMEMDQEDVETVALHFRQVVEHSSEATVAMSSMLDGIDPGEPERAKRKLAVAANTMRRALGLVNRILHRRAKA